MAWLIAGVVTTVTLIASGSVCVWYAAVFNPHQHDQTQTASYAGSPAALTVQLSSGNITITHGPASHIEVRRDLAWTGTKPVTDEKWNGHTLDVSQDCPTGWLDLTCSVSYTIAVPDGVTLNLISESGTITVDGVRSPDVVANSDSGDIWVSLTAAPRVVDAATDSGDVTVKVPPGASYDVHYGTDSGSATVTVNQDPDASRLISATTDSGNIAVAYG
jgi:DUF4097 and DUF4098 domain-containing protein YvlB